MICLLTSLLFSVIAFAQVGVGGQPVTIDLARWIVSGDFEAMWRLRFDTLTVVMLIVVTGVSSMVHLYSIGYMSHDNARARFMAYLSLFTFAMLMLVTADNLVQLFFGGKGWGCLLSADRLLVQERQRPHRGDEGLCRQPRR